METAPVESILWRRLDCPGHDACRLTQERHGWLLEGNAVFCHEAGPARLHYRVSCDSLWQAKAGEVDGWIGATAVRLRMVRFRGRWLLDGTTATGLLDCPDLDFGFTPATNLLQLRRLALAEGAAADIAVAWLDVPAGNLERLEQYYARVSATTYAYRAPRFDYAAELEVNGTGFVVRYPGLWEAVC